MSVFENRDVENEVLRWLDFWDQRRLSMVSRYYKQRMDAEFRKICPHRSSYNQLVIFIQLGMIDACSWILARGRRNGKNTTYYPTIEDVLKSGQLEMLKFALDRWERGEVKLAQDWNNGELLGLMGEPLRQSQRENLDYLWSWLQAEKGLSSDQLPELVENTTRFSLVGLQWLEDHGAINWSDELLVLGLIRLVDSPEAYLYVEKKGKISWSRVTVNLDHYLDLIYAPPAMQKFLLNRSEGLDYAPHYGDIFREAMKGDSSNGVIFHPLLEKGYRPSIDWAFVCQTEEMEEYTHEDPCCEEHRTLDLLRFLQMIHFFAPLTAEEQTFLLLTSQSLHPPYEEEIYDWLRSLS